MNAFQFHQVARQIVLILIPIGLAKSDFAVDVIGIYETLLYIGYALTAFWVTGLIQAVLIQHGKVPHNEQAALITQAYCLLLLLAVGLFLCLYWLEQPLTRLLTSREQLPYFQCFNLYLLLHIPTFLIEHIYLLQQAERPLWRYAFIHAILQLACVFVPIYLGYGLGGVICGWITFALLKHLWLLVQMRQYGHRVWRLDLQRKIISAATPLIGYAFVSSFALTFDNWLVNWWYAGDAAQFAVFRFGARELPLVLVLATAFSTAMLPQVSEHWRAALPIIKQRSRRLFHALFPLSILGICLSHTLFPIIFSTDFRDSAAIFNVYLLIVCSRLVFPHTIIMGLGKSSILTYISLLELLVNIGASLLLIRYYGLVGIALGTVIAYAFEKIAYVWYLHHQHHILFSDYVDVVWFWSYVALTLGTYFAISMIM